MKRMILVLIIALAGLNTLPLYSQLSEEHKSLIKKEIRNEILLLSTTKPVVVTSLPQSRNPISNTIASSIRNNRSAVTQQYLDFYSGILDTLVISHPFVAKKVITNLQVWFEKAPEYNDRFLYYTAASDYFLHSYSEVEVSLKNLIRTFPKSNYQSKALTMLLKTYINDSREQQALLYIEANKSRLDDEQKYLAGHIYFAIDNNSEAIYYFSQSSSGRFKDESEKMLVLLKALNSDKADDVNEAIENFKGMLKIEPDNPFVLLSLARLYSYSGQWKDAEQYYNKYIPAMKQYKEIQVQFELSTSYLNLGNKARAIEILNDNLSKNDMGNYLSPLLYLWSELVTDEGRYGEATFKTQQITQQINKNRELMQTKLDMIQSLSVLKSNLIQNIDIPNINITIDKLGLIAQGLDTLNVQLNQKPYGISQLDINRYQVYEKHMVISFIALLNNYINADRLKDQPDTLHAQQLKALENVYTAQIEQLVKIKESLLLLNDKNIQLGIKNEIEKNISVLDNTLANLYEMKKTGQTKYNPAKLDTLIITNERKKVEKSLLLEYYDIDNALYKQILAECDSSIVAAQTLLEVTPIINEDFQKKYPLYISNKEKAVAKTEIEAREIIIPEYLSSVNKQYKHLDRIKKDLEFINIHNGFVETCYYDRIKKQGEKTLSFEDNQKLFAENQSRKQKVYNQLDTFIKGYQEDPNEKSPIGFPEINIKANGYFALAELGNALWQDKPGIALSNYKKVLEFDPKFYLSDAVLYNIGYLSSSLVKNRIEAGIAAFEAKNTTNRPDSLRYTETTYREPIQAYKRIVNEYKNSQYYSESLFRLGYLYFEIGTNADKPVEYYQIARDYYEPLVEDKDNPYRYKALYQRGWTWLNSSSEEAYNKATVDFTSILKAINDKAIKDSTEAIDYSIASIKNIGYSLIGLDGADINSASKGAEYAKNTLSKMISGKDLNLIIDEAIQQKLKLYIPMQAIDYMNAKIELNPLALENPLIADSICALYKMYPSQIRNQLLADSVDYSQKEVTTPPQNTSSKRYSIKKNDDMLALENPIIADSVFTVRKPVPAKAKIEENPDNVYYAEKGKLTTDYGIDSEWYKANKDKDISKQIKVIKQAYVNLESHKNNQFIDNPNVENFQSYVDLVDQYTSFNELHDEQFNKWNEEKQANIIALNLKLALVTKNPVYYISAAERIYKFNEKFPENKSYLNLEGAAYDCARVVNDSLSTKMNEYMLADPGFKLPLGADSLSTYYDNAAQKFSQVLLNERFRSVQNDKLYINLLMRQAEISRDMKRYAKASEFYEKIISFDGQVSNEIKRSALINLAEIADITKNYAAAEKWYRMAESYGVNTSDKEVLHQYALLQIQNSIDKAKENKDNGLAGEEYLRLASEYSAKDPNKSLQYKAKAQGEYLAANQYQKSIDLLIEMANSLKKPSEVLEFYRFAWTISDSLGDFSQSDSLKHSFISKFPASNEAYQLRLTFIDKKAAVPESTKEAGDMYMSLYNDAIDKKINYGSDNPVDLYRTAIGMYDQAGDEQSKEMYAEQFVSKYPDNKSTIRLMEYLADKQLSKGDSTRYEQISKNIFQKDKASQSRYINIAKDRLRKIASDFNKSFVDKNWQKAFAHRDEFKKVHTAYQKEGLVLDFGPVYEAFTQAEKEYNTLQERLAFLKQYDNQISQLENGFVKRDPDDLLRVNVNTKWKTNIVGGKDNRIQELKNVANAESKRVKQLIESGAKYDIDVDRRLRAFSLICKIYDHGSEVIKIQVDKYMKTSSEFKAFEKQFEGAEDELYSAFNLQRDGHSMYMLQQAYPYYLAMYKYFYIPGYHNKYTINTYERLKAINALPRYKIDELYVDKNWQMTVVDLNDSTQIKTYNGKIDKVTTPSGMNLTKLSIPANSELVINKSFDAKIPYEFMIANIITPYFNDSIVELNKVNIDYSVNPIDTLQAGVQASTRYAMTFGEDAFNAGKNEVSMHYYNYDTTPMDFDINLMVVSDSAKIEAAMPIDTLRVLTDESWEYCVSIPGKPLKDWKKVQKADQFNLPKTQWYEMETSTAEPIWINTKDSVDSLQVVFQKEFNFDGILKEGSVKFISPDIATIKLNDTELSTDYQWNYDSESNLVFAGQVSLTPAMLKQGKNKIQILVNNKSQWKGTVAEFVMTVAHPE